MVAFAVLAALSAPVPPPRRPAAPVPPPVPAARALAYGASTYRATFCPSGWYESYLPCGSGHYAGRWSLHGRRLTVWESPVLEQPPPGGAHRHVWSVDLDAALSGVSTAGVAVRLITGGRP